MDIFEYLLIPPALVIGLAITHLVAGAGRVVHRLAGHGAPVRVDWIHTLWVAHVFLWLIFYWWYNYAWTGTSEWSATVFLFLVGYAVGMYLVSVILVPADLDQVSDFAPYFMSLRGWFFGGLMALILLDFLDSAAKGMDHLLGLGAGYLATRAAMLVGSAVGIRTESRVYHGIFAAVSLVWETGYFWMHKPVMSGG